MAASSYMEICTRLGPSLPAEEQRRRWLRLAELLLVVHKATPTGPGGDPDQKGPSSGRRE